MARIAIIVPIYNVERYLDDCLESLSNQSFKDFEVVLVDDGSPDRSENIYNRYLNEDNRFRLQKQSNQGLGPARNNGLRSVDSEFAVFVDSDDRLDNNFLEKMISAADETGSSIVCCGYKMIDTFGETRKEMLFSSSNITIREKTEKVTLPVNAWGKLYKNIHFEDLDFPAIKYEDLAVIPYITLSAENVSLIPDTLYHYRITPGSLARVNHNDETNMVALDHLIQIFKNKYLFDSYHDEIEYLFVRHLLRYRLMEGWPSLRYLKNVYKYGKINFPKWHKNYYFSTHNDVNDLKLFRILGPLFYKFYLSGRHKFRFDARYI